MTEQPKELTRKEKRLIARLRKEGLLPNEDAKLPNSEPEPIHTEKHPESSSEQHPTSEAKNSGLKEWLTIAALLISLWQAFESRRSTAAAITAAGASASQATTSENQLLLSERPWISSIAEIDGPLTFDINGASIKLRFTLHNNGLTPATNVRTFVKFLPIGHQGNDLDQALKDVCHDAGSDLKFSQQTIFPATNGIQHRKFRLSEDELTKAFSGGTFSANVISCTAYKSTVGKQDTYAEGQVYELRRKSHDLMTPPIQVGKDVPVDDLNLYIRGQDATITGPATYRISPGDFSPIFTEKHSNVVLPRRGESGDTADIWVRE
jgi:hypothetical protein